MPERVKAVRRYAEISLLLPEPVRDLRREQMRYVSLHLYPLNYEVREQDRADTGGGFRVFSDPFTQLITDDRSADMHEVPVYV